MVLVCEGTAASSAAHVDVNSSCVVLSGAAGTCTAVTMQLLLVRCWPSDWSVVGCRMKTTQVGDPCCVARLAPTHLACMPLLWRCLLRKSWL
jgi:hypothetical protein